MPELKIKTDDGAQLFVSEQKGKNPALFFLYGLGCSIKHWKYQLEYFSHHHNIWFDFRGHGNSSHPKNLHQYLTLEKMVHDIHFVMQKQKIPKAVFLGQSMGGTLALLMAHHYPEMVEKLILIGSPVRSPSKGFLIRIGPPQIWKLGIKLHEEMPESMSLLFKIVGKMGFPLREIVRLSGFHPLLSKTEDIEEYIEELFNHDPNLFFCLARALENLDLTPILKTIQTPTLILSGERDFVVSPKECRWVAQQMPNAICEVYRGLSHCPHLDQPELISARIALYLK